MMVGYRTGDMLAPQVDGTEALRNEIQHFLQCIETQQEPHTGGNAGLRVVEILEAASQSMTTWTPRRSPVDYPESNGVAGQSETINLKRSWPTSKSLTSTSKPSTKHQARNRRGDCTSTGQLPVRPGHRTLRNLNEISRHTAQRPSALP